MESEARVFQFFLPNCPGRNQPEQRVDFISPGTQGVLGSDRKFFSINGTQRLPMTVAMWDDRQLGCLLRSLNQISQKCTRNKWGVHCQDKVEVRRRSQQRGMNASQRSAAAKYILDDRGKRGKLLLASYNANVGAD